MQEVTVALKRVCAGDFKTLCHCPFPQKLLVENSKAIKTQMEMDSQKSEKFWPHLQSGHKRPGNRPQLHWFPFYFPFHTNTVRHAQFALWWPDPTSLVFSQKYPSSTSNALTVLFFQRKKSLWGMSAKQREPQRSSVKRKDQKPLGNTHCWTGNGSIWNKRQNSVPDIRVIFLLLSQLSISTGLSQEPEYHWTNSCINRD